MGVSWRFCAKRLWATGKTLGLSRKTGEGKANRLIDGLVYPYFKRYSVSILVDGLFHALVECDSEMSLRRFFRYDAPSS
jgi:hypothetical protein